MIKTITKDPKENEHLLVFKYAKKRRFAQQSIKKFKINSFRNILQG